MTLSRPYAKRRAYMIKAVAKRRRKIKEMAVSHLGGRCIVCGYSRCIASLDFHHLNEKTKRFGLSHDGLTRSWAKTKKELDNCVLLCANCHREVHAGVLQLKVVIPSEKSGEFMET